MSGVSEISEDLTNHGISCGPKYLRSGGQGGGLNPLYQIRGPRSIELALKLQFCTPQFETKD
jgi:hypothetical protein